MATSGKSIPTTSVVIATTAVEARKAALRRAIAGALAQEPRPAVIVVVNGVRYDRALYEELQAMQAITLVYSEVPSYPAAQRLGRSHVATPYFCFLDDDDELLPGSIAARLAHVRAHPDVDVVVARGYRCIDGVDQPDGATFPANDSELLVSLLRHNWFASPAALFATERVGGEFFDGETKYYEWTLMAFRLAAAGRRFGFVEDYGYRLHESPVSLSKESGSTLAVPEVLHALQRLSSSTAVRKELERRLTHAYHDCSTLELSRGNRRLAWRHHLSSLKGPGGLRYLSYTRHLF
ncbi:MAG TPA: glycosyltransferase family 2 protein [Steroidobacteraceae bacterium]|nr:glycosyltransferase family 2 protein [Steroidobacteraceae bacterium]